MNYRHAFHAGNFADVFKHTVLLDMLDALCQKPAPYCYVDTHAGRGRYELDGEQAQRTGEALEGVQRVLAASGLPPSLQRYLDSVRRFQDEASDPASIHRYPGSPLLARTRLREQDRGILCELQPDEAAALKSALQGDPRCAVHLRDGYAALKALLPPVQKRGLVLIDPPFEAQGEEYGAIQVALNEAFARWPNAIYCVWYPIKLQQALQPFHRWLQGHSGKAEVLVVELLLHAAQSPLRLAGCGLAIVNPPWQFDRLLAGWLPTARDLLSDDPQRSHRIEWLKRL